MIARAKRAVRTVLVVMLGSAGVVTAACGNERPARESHPPEVPIVPEAAPEPRATPQTLDRDAPEQPGSDDPAAAAPEDRATLAVGDDFSCAVHAGAVWCWGDGASGQLGAGVRRAANAPVRVVENAVAVAAGATHACAILGTGRATCWGTRAESTRAALPAQLASIDVAGIAAGGDRSCLRSARGDLICVEPDGTVDTRPLPGPVASAVQVGSYHACARFADGRVDCWGEDLRGGRGASQATDARRLALGSTHSCVLLGGGTVRCWGDVHPDRRDTTAVPGPVDRATDAAFVVAGGLHTCVRARDGAWRCTEVVQERVWPSGARGRRVSTPVALPETAVDVALGGSHRCARDAAGAVSCWGNDSHAESSGTTGTDYRPEPVSVALP